MTGNPNDWTMILGGDGFYCIVDYTNANIIYAEYQWGNLAKSTNGGVSFYPATSGISPSDRTNWSTPVIMDPNNHLVLYYGANQLYKTTDGAGYWNAISNDLTNGLGPGGLTYGTITTIAVSKTDSDVVYVGTDDANVWVTTDGGTNWTSINDGLPDRWVTRVAVVPINPAIAYVTFSGYRYDSPLPHVYRTTNYGESWVDISSNLPEVPVNVIVVDPQNTATLYIDTDYGVYYTFNSGGTWSPLGSDLPFSAVDDPVLHNGTRVLRAATHGRSFFEFDLTQSGIKDQIIDGDFKDLELLVMSPIRNEIRISYTLSKTSSVQISLYDIMGRKIQTLIKRTDSPGRHEVTKTVNLPSGTYFVRLKTPDKTQSRKLEIVK